MNLLTAPITRAAESLRELVGGLTWGPFVQLSRVSIISVFSRIERGQLTVVSPDGSLQCFGTAPKGSDAPSCTLMIRKEAFWGRVALFTDMGFAESFILDEVECSDLTAFFKIFILNRSRLSNATTLTSSISNGISNLARGTNTMSTSRLNVSAHYDISNEMFAAFLSEDMTYSCPIWLPKSNPKCSTETLESAQYRKLERFVKNAKIKYSDHVLEIGTGWGSFAIQAVKTTGCKVTTLTLSTEQKELAEKRISAAGYSDRIEVLLCDYRALPTPRVPYDKVVSIEMLENVGREYLSTYFECIDRLLKKDGGIAVFQCITMPESRYEAYSAGQDFIRKYIFPGGHLPNVTQLISAIQSGSKGTLIVDQLENIGGHYSKALRLWNQKFLENFDSRIKPALLLEHPNMTQADIKMFRRKWEYYFTYCEAGFASKTLGDVIITTGRERAVEMLEEVPL
ncbi:MAG: hypothetical protein M1829_002805 [Trizodia sp. TS-e1964]|nr:MAG: hypothetical protein M1829_002805 [Trizodia sp. TS-e1964]